MARMETTRLLRSTTEDEVNSHNNFTKSAVKIILILLSVVATVGILARKGNSSSSSFLRASSSLSSLSLTDLEGNSQTSTLIISTFSDRYPDFERATKYPFLDPKHGLLIEPHRKTTITVQSSIPAEKGVRYIWDIGVKPKASLERLVSSSSTERIESYSSGELETPQASIVIERTQTGVYSLVLTEERFEDNGTPITRTTITRNIYCKYVRRELRELNDEDREAFLDTAFTLWTVSTRRGREELGFGDSYRDITSIALIHNDLAGNAVCDHLHGNFGYNFITGHVALNNMFEQSMQAVNPTVSLPYWSYTQESTLCTPSDTDCVYNIWNSDIFSDKFFGGHGTSRIEDGRWKHSAVPKLDEDTLYKTKPRSKYAYHGYQGCLGQKADAGSTLCDDFMLDFFEKTDKNHVNTKHVSNAYGFVRSPWNMNGDEHVMRSGDFCGRKNRTCQTCFFSE